jgi:hypothetical protein
VEHSQPGLAIGAGDATGAANLGASREYRFGLACRIRLTASQVGE